MTPMTNGSRDGDCRRGGNVYVGSRYRPRRGVRCRMMRGWEPHAASPKKSLAVTLPPVASTIFAIRRLSGMRSPLTYRRTASELTPIRFANWR
jgi:hypothetical protein